MAKSSDWTPERRAKQAEAIRRWAPWNSNTGPRTPEGKARSSMNGLKHGNRSRAAIEHRKETAEFMRAARRAFVDLGI